MATIVAVGAAVGATLAHAVLVGSREKGVPRASGPPWVRRTGFAERVLHGLLAAGWLAGAATGLGARLSGDGLAGWWLWGHMLAAPLFAVGLAGASVAWAERARFERSDGVWLRRGGGYLGGARDLPAGRFDAGQKVFFWWTAAAGWLVLASAMATMVPWFGQGGQARLVTIHRWSGLAITAVVLLHAYVTLLAKPGTWRSMVGGRVARSWAERYHRLWWDGVRQDRETLDDEN